MTNEELNNIGGNILELVERKDKLIQKKDLIIQAQEEYIDWLETLTGTFPLDKREIEQYRELRQKIEEAKK